MTSWDIVLRLAGAAVLGGLVGLERELSDQPAGLRTHLLVSLGAALFALVGADPSAFGLPAGGDGRYDPTRVASQVVSGIGFLGAGAILHHGLNVRGLTTAAALWVSAAVGLASGLGRWLPAVLAALLTVVVLRLLKSLERLLVRRSPTDWRFVVTTGPRPPLATLVEALDQERIELRHLRTLESAADHQRLEAILRLREGDGPERLLHVLGELEGVRGVDYQRAHADPS